MSRAVRAALAALALLAPAACGSELDVPGEPWDADGACWQEERFVGRAPAPAGFTSDVVCATRPDDGRVHLFRSGTFAQLLGWPRVDCPAPPDARCAPGG